MRYSTSVAFFVASLGLIACGDSSGSGSTADTGADTRSDATTDARIDAGTDGGDLDAADARDADSSEAPFDEEACSEFVVPSRLGFRWDAINHRYSSWNHELGREDDQRCRATRLAVSHVGGDFSEGNDETPHLKYGFRERTGSPPAGVGAARRQIDVAIGPDGEAVGSETFQRADLNLREYEDVVALVEGFGFETDVEQSNDYPDDYDPGEGYTLHALGASLDADAREETVELDYRLRVQPGASPDRTTHNEAVPHARLEGRLDVLLVGVGDAARTDGSVEYSYAHEKPTAFEPDDFSPAPEDDQRIALDGAPGFAPGMFGLRSFEFELTPDRECESADDCPEGESCREDATCTREIGPPGFYLREMTVDLDLESYDAESGEATFLLNGYASNASEAIGFWPMRVEFSGAMTWLQTDSVSETYRSESPFETGETNFELDDMKE